MSELIEGNWKFSIVQTGRASWRWIAETCNGVPFTGPNSFSPSSYNKARTCRNFARAFANRHPNGFAH
jgi:hypothetical protein